MVEDVKYYTSQEVIDASTVYFGGDDLAASTFVNKYALRKINDKEEEEFLELTPDDMHDRLTRELYRIESKYSNPISKEKIRELLNGFKYIVPQGSPMAIMGNPYVYGSLSNCVVIDSPGDNISDIFNKARDLANLSKRRCGVGLSLDTLRPDGAVVTNNAKSSTGAWSFADLYSFVCRTIGQSGRRAALMLTLSVRHPDIEQFVTMKRDLTKVTGANISVMLDDEFMNAVINNEDFVLRWPIDVKPEEAKYTKIIKAKDLWYLINESAKICAEPGLIFIDNYKNNLPADYYPNFKSICTNPCLTGDTLIAVADGRGQVSLKELADKNEDVPVYCYNNDMGKVSIRYMRNPKKTAINVPVYKITLDDGNIIRATENHKFYLKNGNIVETKNLKFNDSLQIMTRYIMNYKHLVDNKKSHKSDYYHININGKNKSEHRLIAEFTYNTQIHSDCCVHHKDFNSLNNTPTNLQIISNTEHNNMHRLNKMGADNPMYKRLIEGEWTTKQIEEYKHKQSILSTGENNPRYSGYTNEDLKQHAIILTKQLNRRFSQNEWQEYAQLIGIPLGFSKWRKEHLGGISGLSKWAAIKCGFEYIANIDTRTARIYYNLLEQGYDCIIKNNLCYVVKICEVCNKTFEVHSDNKQASVCSQKCAAFLATNTKGRVEKTIETYLQKSKQNRNEQIQIYLNLKNNYNREPLMKEWEIACKNQNIPYRVGKKCGGFRSYKILKEEASLYNHRVVSVEFDGYEDVYNGTVDEFHNYFIGGFEKIDQHHNIKQSFCLSANCGEILLSKLDSCRLLSQNLKYYVINPFTKDAYFDFELFIQNTRIAMRLIDDIVDLEIECIDKILSKIDEPDEIYIWEALKQSGIRGRRTGLGTHGLADALSRLTIKYDTEKAIKIVEKIYQTQRDAAYDESVNMAIERGKFPEFNWDYEKDCDFIKRLPQELQEKIKKHGRRNISLLTNAPTGSVSIESQTSSGIEPVFLNFYTRRKKINPHDNNSRIDFVDLLGDKWTEYSVFHHNIMDYLKSNSEIWKQWEQIEQNTNPSEWSDELSKILPDYFITSSQIDPLMRVKIQAAAQTSIDHGLSSTINCPKNTSIENVQNIYLNAWKQGLKGVTVYVDGSRSGVLISVSDKKENSDNIVETMAPKRPKILSCDIHRSTIDDGDWTILVGLLNGKPYEIFGGLSENIVLPKKYKLGKILKRKCVPDKSSLSCYDLYTGEDDDELIVKDISAVFKNDYYAIHTRLISLHLRHGIPIQFIIEQIGKDHNTSFHSFFKVIARVLKKYVKDGVKSGETCTECGTKLRFESGCMSCPDCGYSKCN